MSHSNSERLYLRGQFRTDKNAYLTLARSEERRDRTGVVQSKQSSVLHTGVDFFKSLQSSFPAMEGLPRLNYLRVGPS